MELITVLVGSAAGGMARFWLANAVARRYGERFPWGTLVVNVSGAVAAGMCAALLSNWHPGEGASLAWRLGIVGFLGSYTTVSSFSLQTLALAHDGAWGRAAGNVALSLGLCLGAVCLGWWLGDGLTGTLP
jgi:fluoride exporter